MADVLDEKEGVDTDVEEEHCDEGPAHHVLSTRFLDPLSEATHVVQEYQASYLVEDFKALEQGFFKGLVHTQVDHGGKCDLELHEELEPDEVWEEDRGHRKNCTSQQEEDWVEEACSLGVLKAFVNGTVLSFKGDASALNLRKLFAVKVGDEDRHDNDDDAENDQTDRIHDQVRSIKESPLVAKISVVA